MTNSERQMEMTITQVVSELQEDVRYFIEVKARVTIDLPRYRSFYDKIQQFVGCFGLVDTAEWKELDKWLIHTSREHMVNKEACAIQRALEALKERALLIQNNVHDNYWDYVHPKITAVARDAFESNLFALSVEAAFKELNVQVKARIKKDFPELRMEKDGVSLMQTVFSPNNPMLKVEYEIESASGRNTQTGYMNMFAGAISAIRNPKAHENMTISKDDAIRKLYFASMLMYKLDNAIAVHRQE